jgi:DNA-binding NarL/FixJ family response regulator
VAVVMMDLKMPGTDGVTCIRRLRERGHSGKVVVLSGYLDAQSIQEAARAGADGFLTKPVKPGDLVAALEYCWSGGIPLAADLRSYLERPQPAPTSAKVADPLLTELENRILDELQTGDTYAQIADRLKLSEAVLKKAVHTAYGKLGVNNKVSALRKWHQHRRGQNPD